MSTNTNSSRTNKEWLARAQNKLKQAGIATDRLDCLVLLEDATKKDKSYLLAHPELPLHDLALKRLEGQIERRCKHEPLAYIRGKSEFYGREFKVTPDTLEPRPETETMIDLFTKIIKTDVFRTNDSLKIADVGTGSGCLAITAKLEIPGAEVFATDISPACLRVAKKNAKNLGADVKYFQGDLLQPIFAGSPELRVQSQKKRPEKLSALSSQLTAILANLPYVPDKHTINEAAMHEPRIAIFGGPDGLDLYRRMFQQLADLSQKPDYVFTEALPMQHKELEIIAKMAGYMIHKTDDFIQVFKPRLEELVWSQESKELQHVAVL